MPALVAVPCELRNKPVEPPLVALSVAACVRVHASVLEAMQTLARKQQQPTQHAMSNAEANIAEGPATPAMANVTASAAAAATSAPIPASGMTNTSTHSASKASTATGPTATTVTPTASAVGSSDLLVSGAATTALQLARWVQLMLADLSTPLPPQTTLVGLARDLCALAGLALRLSARTSAASPTSTADISVATMNKGTGTGTGTDTSTNTNTR